MGPVFFFGLRGRPPPRCRTPAWSCWGIGARSHRIPNAPLPSPTPPVSHGPGTVGPLAATRSIYIADGFQGEGVLPPPQTFCNLFERCGFKRHQFQNSPTLGRSLESSQDVAYHKSYTNCLTCRGQPPSHTYIPPPPLVGTDCLLIFCTTNSPPCAGVPCFSWGTVPPL